MISSRSPNLTDKHVGNRLRMRRLMIKMSQTELSRALGLTWQSVQKYENGTNRIGASRLQQISHILQVSPGYFFEGAPDIVRARTFASVSSAASEQLKRLSPCRSGGVPV